MLPKLSLQSKTSAKNLIFISYRRSDTEGYAGRLEDTLRRYFGKNRVFRDVGGITPGEDFKHKIEETIEASGSLIVLIGPNWLVHNKNGLSRLHEPDDQVAYEITAALKRGSVVLPVLVEGAKMPREEDLPDKLKELTRRNAVTINDERWLFDVTRLAKVLAMDISGSVVERRVSQQRIIILTLLFVGMAFNILMFTRAAFSTTCIASLTNKKLYPKETEGAPDEFRKSLSWSCEWTDSNEQEDLTEDDVECKLSCEKKLPDARPFSKLEAVINPFLIVTVILLLTGTRTLVEHTRRKFIWAAVFLGSLGCALTMIYYLLTVGFNPVAARTTAFAATSIINVGMLTLVGLSGFKPNERLN